MEAKPLDNKYRRQKKEINRKEQDCEKFGMRVGKLII